MTTSALLVNYCSVLVSDDIVIFRLHGDSLAPALHLAPLVIIIHKLFASTSYHLLIQVSYYYPFYTLYSLSLSLSFSRSVCIFHSHLRFSRCSLLHNVTTRKTRLSFIHSIIFSHCPLLCLTLVLAFILNSNFFT